MIGGFLIANSIEIGLHKVLQELEMVYRDKNDFELVAKAYRWDIQNTSACLVSFLAINYMITSYI